MNGNSRKDGGKQFQIASCVTSSIKSFISGGNTFPLASRAVKLTVALGAKNTTRFILTDTNRKDQGRDTIRNYTFNLSC